jgi:hypothetical protein
MTNKAPADPVAEIARLRTVAEAAQFLVGSVELGENRNLTLHAASKVSQALAALGYPADDEGLIDFAGLVRPVAGDENDPDPDMIDGLGAIYGDDPKGGRR